MLFATVLTVLTTNVPPNPIYDASAYTHHVANHSHGVLYRVAAPNATPFSVLHVFSTPRERGEAHGYLLSAEIMSFVEHQMNDFFKESQSSADTAAAGGAIRLEGGRTRRHEPPYLRQGYSRPLTCLSARVEEVCRRSKRRGGVLGAGRPCHDGHP